ncbi:MAG: carbamate kinase [Roseburia sp.]|nr:carbamate kinase [Roseburia sp.]
MKKKIVIALGGNSLGNEPSELEHFSSQIASEIVNIYKMGYTVIITHGNGPQVGMLDHALQSEFTDINNSPAIPLSVSVALSQSYIGYYIGKSIRNALHDLQLHQTSITTVSTHVEISSDDPAFQNPEKPIGNYYNEADYVKLQSATNFMYKKDENGYRRIVPSPKPLAIREIDSIKSLVDAGDIVICCGGGGIPVYPNTRYSENIDAVIDKDHVSCLLAKELDADILMLLTGVDYVSIHFKQPNEKKLQTVTTKELQAYTSDGLFPAGSMLPKIEAAIDFCSKGDNKKTIITSLNKATESLSGTIGTIITK